MFTSFLIRENHRLRTHIVYTGMQRKAPCGGMLSRGILLLPEQTSLNMMTSMLKI